MKTSNLLCFVSALASIIDGGDAAANFHPVAHKISASLAGPDGGSATFEQLIDHTNPSIGTFPQRYWWNTTFWKGPGSPVCLDKPHYTDMLLIPAQRLFSSPLARLRRQHILVI